MSKPAQTPKTPIINPPSPASRRKPGKSTAPAPSQIALDIGTASQQLRRIRLEIPRIQRFVRALEALRVSGLGRNPGDACRGLRAIHPTGCGKSEGAKELVAFVQGQPGRDPEMTPVLHVTLSTAGSPKSAIASCLKAFEGGGYSTVGSESDLLERLKVALGENGTELLIVDELNHCAQKTMGRDVSDTLKNIMTKGWVPVALLGTSDADVLFKQNKELKGRCKIFPGLRPMDPVADAEDWRSFCAGMDLEMERLKIVSRPAGIGDEDLAEALCIACAGRIGELINILDDALDMMIGDGRHHIEFEDLRRAVEVRFVLDGDLEANPLVESE